jgi:hypothetical protein
MQQRERHLAVGTHGRSIFISDVTELQQLTPEVLEQPLHVFAVESVTHNPEWGNSWSSWVDPSTPEVRVPFFAGRDGAATIRVLTEDDLELQTLTHEAERGLNYATYDLTVTSDAAERVNEQIEDEATDADEEPATMEEADNGMLYLLPGTYTLEVTLGETTETTTLEVTAPPEASEAAPRMGPDEGEEIK